MDVIEVILISSMVGCILMIIHNIADHKGDE